MYCRFCGAENDDAMKYCVNCGKELNADNADLSDAPTSATKQSTAADAPPKKLSKKTKVIMLIIAVVAVLAVAAYRILGWLMSPEYVVSQYIKAQSEENYSALYSMLDMPDSDFTTKEQFVDVLEKSSNDGEKESVSKITVTEVDSSEYSTLSRCYSDMTFDKAYQAKYVTQNGDTKNNTVLLSSEKLLFFEKYKVAPAEYLTKKYEVSAPLYAKVKFDGIELGDKYIDDETSHDGDASRQNWYLLKNVLLGKHNITITAPFIQTAEIKVDVNASDSFDCADELNIKQLKIKQSVKDEMQKTAEETLRVIFDGAAKKKDFSQIESNLKIASGKNADVKEGYENFSDTEWSGFRNETITYKKLELSEIEPASDDAFRLNRRDDMPLSYMIRFKVVCDVTENQGYILWGDTHNESTHEIYIQFTYENDEAKVCGISNYNLDWDNDYLN